jgi:hypothetical protein
MFLYEYEMMRLKALGLGFSRSRRYILVQPASINCTRTYCTWAAGVAGSRRTRNHQLELGIPDKRVASHDRQMQGLEAVDDLENAVYQFLPFAIAEISQSHPAAQMRVIIRIASRTTQRAFARDLNGQRGPLSFENLAPRANNC